MIVKHPDHEQRCQTCMNYGKLDACPNFTKTKFIHKQPMITKLSDAEVKKAFRLVASLTAKIGCASWLKKESL